jgi:hypothetical protein
MAISMILHVVVLFAFYIVFVHSFSVKSYRLRISTSNRLRSIASSLQMSTNENASVISKENDTKEKRYIMCSACKTAYIPDMNLFQQHKVGCRVRCSICDKEWFQTIDKMMRADETATLSDMPEEKVAEVKRILADKNFPKYPRVDKIGLFVGNLPYSYTEQDITDLFAEYGLIGVSLIKAPDGASKGFAFVDVRTCL